MSTLQVDRIIPYQSSSVVVEGLSAPNLATTGSNTFVGDQDIQGTITASIQEGFALVGGVGNVSTLVATSSFGGALPSGVVSGSSQISGLGFATTGSNVFRGNQTITGSLTISGSDNFDLVVQGRQLIIGPTTGQVPQLIISSSDGTNTINRNSTNISNTAFGNTTNPRLIQLGKVGFDYPLFSAQYTDQSSSLSNIFTDNITQTASFTVGVFDNAFTQDVELVLETTTTNGILFKDYNTSTGAYAAFLKIAPNGGSNPPLEFKRSAEVTGSVNIQNTLTASLQQGYVWVGDASGRTTTVPTSSLVDLSSLNAFTASQQVLNTTFATTGSNSFVGNQTITGSLSINNDIFVSSSDIFLTGSGGSFVNIFQNSPGEQTSAIRFYSGSTIDQIGRGGQIRVGGNGTSINIASFGVGQTSLVDFDFINLQTLFSQNVSVVGSKTLTVSGTGSGEFSSIGPRGTISLSSGSSDIVFNAAQIPFGPENANYNFIARPNDDKRIILDIYNVESTLAINITATGSFIQDFSAVTNVNENAIKLQPYSDYQRGQVTILRDLDVSGSTFVSGSVRGNVASASIASNTASLDFGSSNFFTLTLVSGSSTHIVPQNVGTGQTINLKVVQPSVGVGTISFPSSFKFPEVAPYTASLLSDSVDVVTFITFEDTGSIYSVAVKRLV